MYGKAYSSTVFGKATIKALSVVVLCLLSVALFNTDARFTVTATGILPNQDFSKLVIHWTGTPTGIALRPTNPPTLLLRNKSGNQTVLAQSLPEPVNSGLIRVGADILLDNVEPGPLWWQRAGILLYSYDKAGRRLYYWPSEIAMVEGSQDWHRYQEVIPVAMNSGRMELILFLGADQGTVEVRNLNVDRLVPAVWFGPVRTLLIGGWIAAGIWILLPLLVRNRRSVTACLAFFVFLTILAGTLTPQPELSIAVGGARHLFDTATTPLHRKASHMEAADSGNPADHKPKSGGTAESRSGDPAKKTQDQATGAEEAPDSVPTSTRIAAAMPRALTSDGGSFTAHYLIHVLLGALVLLAFPQSSRLWLAACLLLAAMATEIAQYFVVTRGVTLMDAVMNAGGVATGFVIALIWIALRNRSRVSPGHIPAG
jgi:hypothetical protein